MSSEPSFIDIQGEREKAWLKVANLPFATVYRLESGATEDGE